MNATEYYIKQSIGSYETNIDIARQKIAEAIVLSDRDDLEYWQKDLKEKMDKLSKLTEWIKDNE